MCITVIIPVYQAERFLQRAVLSALDQAAVSEIILVEDCSTDASLQLCKRLTNDYSSSVTLYRHKDGLNHGAGASRNLGILKASTEFIAFLDADDFYLPGRFIHDLEILNSKSSVDGVYNALGIHVYDNTELERVNFKLTTVTYPIPAGKLFEEMSPIGACGYFHGDTLTVRAEVFNKVGYFNETLELSQDTHMWVKMAATLSLVAGDIGSPVAVRGIHVGNRVKDVKKFNYYRPLLFLSLMEWAKCNGVSYRRRALLWDCLNVNNRKLIKRMEINKIRKIIMTYIFLIKHGISKPYLFLHKQYIYSIIIGWR